MSNIRPIVSPNCRCKLCNKSIEKGTHAYVFSTSLAGRRHDIHLHIDCLRKMQEEIELWDYMKN